MIVEIDVIEKLSKEIDVLYAELSEDHQKYQGLSDTILLILIL